MSDADAAATVAAPGPGPAGAPDPTAPAGRPAGLVLAPPRDVVPLVVGAVLVVLLLLVPLYLGAFWLSLGLFCMAAVVGAIGLNLLTGTTGQLSLAHAFFLAVGAYGYSYLSGSTASVGGGITAHGLGLPTVVGMIGATLAAGVAGLLFSPIAGRLRGIYLGVASLALVFLGQHLLQNVTPVTGGFNGRPAPQFDLFGFRFADTDPQLFVLNVPFGTREKLWYLFLFLAVVSYLFARNVLRGRPGRAMTIVRDSEVAGSVMGVSVRRYKASAFVLSSMYAGLAGVMLALAYRRPVPDTFQLTQSVEFLAMIVIGGLGSVAGAAIGATFVTALPQVLQQYGDKVPFIAATGTSGGIDASVAAQLVYGAAIILVIMLEPGGLVALLRRLRPHRGRPRTPPAGAAGGHGPADPSPRDRQLEERTA